MSKAENNDNSHMLHPVEQLKQLAEEWNLDVLGIEFAKRMDEVDPLRKFRDMFYYPKNKTLFETDTNLVDPEDDCIYFANYSLGLLSRNSEQLVKSELTKWAEQGAQGYAMGAKPWIFCDERCEEEIAKLIGAKREEVALMNGLSVNLHLLLFIIKSQISFHGYDQEKSLIYIGPREGEDLLRLEDILAKIEEEGDTISVIMFGGVQYYTGQVLEMEAITQAGHAKGCFVGFDLAHAVGNIETQLHQWSVDFAGFCTNKYLNSGPGCIAGAFLHEKHKNNNFPKFHGWWSHKIETRFEFSSELQVSPGISGYRITSPPSLLCASLEGSLEVFKQTSIKELRTKSKLLTGYLEFLITQNFPKGKEGQPWVEIITSLDPEKRGCQLSLKCSVPVEKVITELKKRGVVVDQRGPDIMRVAPAPLYNSFQEICVFIGYLGAALKVSKCSNIEYL